MTVTDRVRELAAEARAGDRGAAQAAGARQAALAKPAGSLGDLERLGGQLAAIAGASPPPVPTDPALVIAVGDHGVHARGVTPWPQGVTRQMVTAFCQGRAAANVLAATVGARVTVLDVGVAGPVPSHPLLRAARVRDGTADLLMGPAMTGDDAARAVLAGAGVAEELLAAGTDLLLTGDMGIANTTPAACLVAALTGSDPEQVTGRGSGIDAATLARKQAVVRGALERHGDDRDPLAVLTSLGGLEHAALVGVVLTAAAEAVPVILDGISTVGAALVAVALNPAVADYVVAGHRSVEPGAAIGLAHLDLVPLLDLGMRLGEGTGALLAVPLVQSAARLLHDVATLAELQDPTP